MSGVVAERQAVQVIVDAYAQVVRDPLADALGVIVVDVVRGGANPSRSLANVVSGQWPWARPRDHADLLAAALPKPAPRKHDSTTP